MKINADFEAVVHLHTADLPWTPSPISGVERRMLYREGDEVAKATSLVRYAPGSAFSAHTHHGGEEFLVLDGIFSDEHGDYSKGCYVRNPVKSKHTPRSENGCTILVSLWQMHPSDQEYVRVDTLDSNNRSNINAVVHQIQLHMFQDEEIVFLSWQGDGVGEMQFRGSNYFADNTGKSFILEIYVVSAPDPATINSQKTSLITGDWYRQPWRESEIRLNAVAGTQLLIKRSLQRQPPPTK